MFMKALSPLIFFVVVYLAAGIVAGDFYKVPITVAFTLTSVFAIAVGKGKLSERIETFGRGAAHKNIMLMIWIFVLAGAFAQSAKQMGSIDEVVNLTLSIVPPDALYIGLLLAAAIVSVSIGTSVGTIVALTPIAVGIANTTGLNVPMVTAIIVGGAFFGDNLSFISDTTVVATQTQGCKMSDKFRTNIYIALPALVLTVLLYMFMSADLAKTATVPDPHIIKVLPYLLVIVIAILGVNVLVVLCLGILATGVVGLLYGDYTIYSWFSAMGEGINGMGELIIVTMLAGGVLEMISVNGGISYVMDKILKMTKSVRGAEFSIAALVSFVDVCTANNTVAIITVSGLAKEITERFKLDNRRVASILDTFSCIMQGVLPYGAQLLMASALASCSAVEIIPYLYYPYALLLVALLSIIFRFPRLKERVEAKQ